MSDWGYFPLAGPGGIAGMVGMLPMVVVWMAGWSGMNLRRTVVVVANIAPCIANIAPYIGIIGPL